MCSWISRRFVVGLSCGASWSCTCPGRLRPAGCGARPSGLRRSAHRYRSSRSIGRGLTVGPARSAGRQAGANDLVRIIVVTLPIGIDAKRSPRKHSPQTTDLTGVCLWREVKGPQQLPVAPCVRTARADSHAATAGSGSGTIDHEYAAIIVRLVAGRLPLAAVGCSQEPKFQFDELDFVPDARGIDRIFAGQVRDPDPGLRRGPGSRRTAESEFNSTSS